MSANQVIEPINDECPICMESIEGLCNRVVTECGHSFHCACLMQNAAHNGFGCPYCRTVMATEPLEEEEDDEDDDGWSVEESVFEEDALTSFRMFHQRNNGEELEEELEDDEEDDDDDDWGTDDEEEDELVTTQPTQVTTQPTQVTTQPTQVTEPVTRQPAVPDSTYTSDKLKERGITYEDLVKHILYLEHDEWNENYREYTTRSDVVYGQFRAVMSQYLRNRRTNQNQTNQTNQNQTTQNQTNQNQTNQTNQNQTTQNQTNQNQTTILTAPEVAETKTSVMPRHREVLTYA
jgi:hypothetical protein